MLLLLLADGLCDTGQVPGVVPGPLSNEVKEMHEIWTDETTGYRCVVMTGPVGALNGYVEVPAEHPWNDHTGYLCGHPGCYEHTPSALLHVHGGVTYEGKMSESGLSGYLFGFDCAHSGDLVPDGLHRPGDVFRDADYVRSECTQLAAQLHEVASRSGE